MNAEHIYFKIEGVDKFFRILSAAPFVGDKYRITFLLEPILLLDYLDCNIRPIRME